MEKKTIAAHYATTLLKAIAEQGEVVTNIQCDLQAILSCLAQSCPSARLFCSRFVPKNRKLAIWESILQLLNKDEHKIRKITNLFIKSLIDNNRTHLLSEILLSLEEQRLQQANIAKVKVVVAWKIDQDHRRRVCETISELLKKEVSVNFEVQKTILGGMIVTYGSKYLDLSMQKRLKDIYTAVVQPT